MFYNFIAKRNPILFNSTAFSQIYASILKITNPNLFKLYNYIYRCLPIDKKDLFSFFKEKEIETFIAENLLSHSEPNFRFLYRIVPLGKLLIVCNPEIEKDTENYVHIGGDTLLLWKFAEQNIGDKSFGMVLDVGCGAGYLSLRMSKYADSVHATDINNAALELTKLNAQRNDCNNIFAFESDVYSNIDNKYDLIISNPPYEFLPDKDNKLRHFYGGRMGNEITTKILEDLDRYLSPRGQAFILTKAYIKKSGENELISTIENIFREKNYSVVLFESSYQTSREHKSFYQKNRISHSITYLISIKRSYDPEMIVVPLKSWKKLKNMIRMKML
ncbi:methyltransferase [Acidobacteriota bacterium]